MVKAMRIGLYFTYFNVYVLYVDPFDGLQYIIIKGKRYDLI